MIPAPKPPLRGLPAWLASGIFSYGKSAAAAEVSSCRLNQKPSSCSSPAATEGPEQEKLATKAKEVPEPPLAWLQEEQSDDFLAML